MHLYTRRLALTDLPVATRPGVASLDDLPPSLRHLAFDRVVGLFGEAWVSFLRSLGDLMPPRAVGVVHVSCDYLREVKPGELTVTVAVQRLGTTSVTLALELVQDRATAARATVVLAHKDFVTVRAIPLQRAQRDALAAHLVAPG